MRIQIETRNRWRFTVTSPNHDDVEKTVRPGAKPFASNDSKSTSTVGNSILKTSGRSLDAYGIADEVWPAPKLPPKVSRSRSFGKRICRFLVQISRMHPEDHACAYYDSVDPLPPYELCPELPADSFEGSSAVQELPGSLLMTPELLSQEVPSELECYNPHDYHVQDFPMDTVQSMSVRSQFEVPNKQRYSPMGYTTHQACEPVETPVYLPSLNTEQHMYALPGMISGGHSHNSSPISPFTPQASPGTQPPPASNFSNDIVSPHELVSHSTDHYTMEEQVYQGVQDYCAPPVISTLISTYPTGRPDSSTPTTDNESFNTQQYISFSSSSSSSIHNLTQYQQQSQELPTPQYSFPHPEIHMPGYEDCRLDTWERDGDSAWIRQPTQELGMVENNNTNHLPRDDVAHERHRAALHHAEHHHQETPPADGSPNENTTIPYPPVFCGDCGTEFNGRYRKGNLKRHVRERHSLIKSMVGKACRVCKQVYRRADAKRKHEWKKHRLLDAKPTKRRN